MSGRHGGESARVPFVQLDLFERSWVVGLRVAKMQFQGIEAPFGNIA